MSANLDQIECLADVGAEVALEIMECGFGSPATIEDGGADVKIIGSITSRYDRTGAIATGQQDTHSITFETYKRDTATTDYDVFPPATAVARGRFIARPKLTITDENTVYIVTNIVMSPEDISTSASFVIEAERFGIMNEVANA